MWKKQGEKSWDKKVKGQTELKSENGTIGSETGDKRNKKDKKNQETKEFVFEFPYLNIANTNSLRPGI